MPPTVYEYVNRFQQYLIEVLNRIRSRLAQAQALAFRRRLHAKRCHSPEPLAKRNIIDRGGGYALDADLAMRAFPGGDRMRARQNMYAQPGTPFQHLYNQYAQPAAFSDGTVYGYGPYYNHN